MLTYYHFLTHSRQTSKLKKGQTLAFLDCTSKGVYELIFSIHDIDSKSSTQQKINFILSYSDKQQEDINPNLFKDPLEDVHAFPKDNNKN